MTVLATVVAPQTSGHAKFGFHVGFLSSLKGGVKEIVGYIPIKCIYEKCSHFRYT